MFRKHYVMVIVIQNVFLFHFRIRLRADCFNFGISILARDIMFNETYQLALITLKNLRLVFQGVLGLF